MKTIRRAKLDFLFRFEYYLDHKLNIFGAL
jgi:hypothetical protein